MRPGVPNCGGMAMWTGSDGSQFSLAGERIGQCGPQGAQLHAASQLSAAQCTRDRTENPGALRDHPEREDVGLPYRRLDVPVLTKAMPMSDRAPVAWRPGCGDRLPGLMYRVVERQRARYRTDGGRGCSSSSNC